MPDKASVRIELVGYDPSWSVIFQELKVVIVETLGDLALAVEHVGSTSVPGLSAKPIIDLDVVIASEEQLGEVVKKLETLGYHYEGNLGIEGREVFKRDELDVPRDGSGRKWLTHHLYVCPQYSRELTQHLAFRDYLRSHPETAEEYLALKRELAGKFADNRPAYSMGKTEFVTRVLRQAIDRSE